MSQQENKDIAFDMIDALNAPLLTFSVSWADSIPKRIKDIIPQARLIALMKREPLATYPEIVFIFRQDHLRLPWTTNGQTFILMYRVR